MLRLYYHPFASFCQKALIALYEREIPFEPVLIDLGNAEERAMLQAVWPFAKFPVLRDEGHDRTVPESTLIIDYLDRHYGDAPRLTPPNEDAALKVRLLDRVFDNYVSAPLTRIVLDSIRPEGRRDPDGVEDARRLIATAYNMLEEALGEDGWAAGADFSLADCAAAPSLFYANTAVPLREHRKLAAYHQRLLDRPSFARVVAEARPYRHLFPLPWPAEYA